MSLVQSFTVILLASVSFNIATYAADADADADKDELTGAPTRSQLKIKATPGGKKGGGGAPPKGEKEEKDKRGQTPAPSDNDEEEVVEVVNVSPPAEVSSAAATPKPYQATRDRLLGELSAYTDARGASALSYSFPTQIDLSTFSGRPDAEFNPLFREVADEFYTLYGIGDEENFSQVKERVMAWISQRTFQMTEQKQKLIHDQEGREDGILKDLKSSVTKLEEHIATYDLLFKETLYRMDKTRTFVQYILTAIKDTKASIDALKDMLSKETSAAMRASHEAGISKLSSNIEKFQSWLLSTEVVIHTLYPFHREGLYFIGFRIPQFGQKSSRRELTGVTNLPPSLTLTAGDIADSKIDEQQHFTKYMQAMLSLEGVMLVQAKTQKRFTEVREDK